MTDSTFHLFQLQKLDSVLAQYKQQELDLRTKIDDLSLVNSTRKDLDQAMEKLQEEKRKSENIESSLSSKRIKLAQSESSLYSGKIQNPKELQDLQLEIASLKKAIMVLEDSQIGSWEKLEILTAESEVKSNNFKNAESNSALHNQEMENELSRLLIDQQRVNLEKNAVTSQISPAFLSIYQKLLLSKKGVAVSEIEDSSCGICGTTLTPSECQLARNHSVIQLCSNCGRILYAG